MPKDEAEYERMRAAERAREARPMLWAVAAAAAIASGKDASNAQSIADKVLSGYESRFVAQHPTLDPA